MLLNAQAKNPLADGIRRETHNKKRNYNIIITGKTQTGKSQLAVALALGINPKFDLDKNMAVIDAGKLLEILKDNVRKYSVILADDFGIGLSSDKWHSFMNRALNQIIQTHGHKRPVFILTVPYKKFVDSKTRIMFDMQITTLEKNDAEGWVRVKVELLHNRQIKNTIQEYRPFPRALFKDGSVRRIDSIRIKFPPEDIRKRYFEISKAEKEKLTADLMIANAEIESEKKRMHFNLEGEIMKVMNEPEKFVTSYLGRYFIDKTAVQKYCSVGGARANQIKKEAEKRLGDRIATIQPASAQDNEGGGGTMDSESRERAA